MHDGSISIFAQLAEGTLDGVLGFDAHVAEIVRVIVLIGTADLNLSCQLVAIQMMREQFDRIVSDVPGVVGNL